MEKKMINLLMLITLIGWSSMAVAQQSRNQEGTMREGTKRAQTFYVEALGPGLISANYDFRFAEKPNGWGGRAGIGYFAADGASFMAIPVQVNYLLGGKNGNYFEIGGGASYVKASARSLFSDDNATGDDVMGSLTFGYRLQPIGGGFNFRAGLSPLFSSGYFIPYWPHLSFGYTF